VSKKVTEMSLLSAFRDVKDNAMEAKRNGPGHDVYEVRPHKGSDGVDLISDRFRRGPIWYAGPGAVSKAVAYAKYHSLTLAPGSYPRVGRLRRCNPGARIGRFVSIRALVPLAM
jgi:hypothetical protein